MASRYPRGSSSAWRGGATDVCEEAVVVCLTGDVVGKFHAEGHRRTEDRRHRA
jgi:hypothetical protein